VNIENPKQLQASGEFNQIIIAKLATDKGVHAETAIAVASRMAGTFVLRATGLPITTLKPGTPVFSDVIDNQGQPVLATIDQALASLGIPVDRRKVNFDLSDEHRCHLKLMETQAMFDPLFRPIVAKYGLTDAEAAHAAAFAAADLIQKCAQVLNPYIAYAVAAYAMIEGCKTVPFDADRATVAAH